VKLRLCGGTSLHDDSAHIVVAHRSSVVEVHISQWYRERLLGIDQPIRDEQLRRGPQRRSGPRRRDQRDARLFKVG
jgi:hypothetical protein